jgi:hypothetical protein
MSRDALVVGINTYTHRSLGNLRAPAEDAEAIAQCLTQHGGFHPVKRLPEMVAEDGGIQVGQTTKVTLNELEEALVQLFKPESSGRDLPETALFFFSGHGLRKDKGIQEGFLATSDADPNVGFYGLSLKWLRELLQASPILQQIIWLDCCYSGNLLNFQEADPGNRGKGRDRFFIAACRDFELAYEETIGQHGVLTASLLQGLDPKRQPDGLVTNYTLTDFLGRGITSSPQRYLYANSGSEIILTGTKIISTMPVVAGICPYKGLQYFDFNDEDPKYFYGRTALTDELIDKVRQNNFLAVMGASGSGKSSLVRAGLLYQLKLGQRLSGSDRWVIKILRLGNYPNLSQHPLRCLAQVFVDETLSEIDQASQSAKAQELLETGAVGLSHLIQAFKAERVVLVIDQFEEVFTLCPDHNERQRFFECLLKTAEDVGNTFTLVLALRADFYGKCAEQEYAGLARKIEEHLLTVIPMSEEELAQAIVEPAKQVNLDIEPELVTQMIQDVADSPGHLPLLAYTLKQLWQQRTVDRLMLSAYTRLGGVKGALQKRATEVYESLSPEEQQTAKHIFLELTQLGEWTEVTRRRVLKQDLITSKYSVDLVDKVIQKLANEDVRLLVTSELGQKGENSSRVAVVDVAHEALIRHWPRLCDWVNENRDALRKKRTFEEDAQEWLNKAKSEDYLLRGSKLSEAIDFHQRYAENMPLTSIGQEFVQESRKARDRRKFWRIGLATASLATLATFGGLLWSQQLENHYIQIVQLALDGNFFDPDIVKILNENLSKADQLATNKDIDKSLAEYRQVWTIAYGAQQNTEDDSEQSQQIKNYLNDFKSIQNRAEKSLVDMIIKERLSQLEVNLKKGNLGERLNHKPADFENRFTKGSALQYTYKVLMQRFGIQADLNTNGTLETYDESNRLPCTLLIEIEKKWHMYAGKFCGWYGSKNEKDPSIDPSISSRCSSFNYETLTSLLFTYESFPFIEDRFKQCSIIPKIN